MSNLLPHTERTLRDLAAACGDCTRPDWLAQVHLMAAHRLVDVFVCNSGDLAPPRLHTAAATTAKWRRNRAALASVKRRFDSDMESQRLNFLPEAQNERNLLPLEAVKGFVAVTERLPPYLHALVLANLTSAVEDRAAARLIARVQKYLLRCTVLAGYLYRAWMIVLENDAARLLGHPLPHSINMQTLPYRLNSALKVFAVYRERLLADIVDHRTPAAEPTVASQPMAATEPMAISEPMAAVAGSSPSTEPALN